MTKGTQEYIERKSSQPEGSEKKYDPIFVGGMERSGTSLIRAVIGSHSDIAFYELDHLFWIYSVPGNASSWNKISNTELMLKMFNDLFDTSKYTYLVYKPDPEKVRETLQKYDMESVRDYHRFCGILFSAFIEEYQRIRGKRAWAFKSPWNEFHTEGIFRAYPQARFIHLYRDIYAVTSSILKAKMIKEDNLNAMIEHTLRWNRSLEALQQNLDRHGPQYLGIRYESFVADPESYTRILCGFLNLDYQPQMLEMKGQPNWKGSNSSFEVRKNCISRELADKKITNLKNDEIRLIQLITGLHTKLVREKYRSYSPYTVESQGLNRLGEFFYEQGRKSLADLAFKKALHADQENVSAMNNLGVIRYADQLIQEAYPFFMHALQKEPQNRTAILNLGQLLEESGRAKESVQLYKKYLEAFPHDREMQKKYTCAVQIG